MTSLADMGNLSGRAALVIGAGRLGVVAAEALAEMGAAVAIADKAPDVAESAATDVRAAGGPSAVAVHCDLADESSTRGAVRHTIERLGGLEILVHCAALVGTTDLEGWAVDFGEQTAAVWELAIKVNLTSAFVLAHEAREALAENGRGSVILFASIHGVVAADPRIYGGTSMNSPSGYAASKGGLIQLTRTLAAILAPAVRVNAISPGGVLANQPDAFVRRYEDRCPLGRMASPQDVKGAVAYLASDLSSYVTGHNLIVDGGWTLW